MKMHCCFKNNTVSKPVIHRSSSRITVLRCRCSTAAPEHIASNHDSSSNTGSSNSQQEESWQYTAPDDVVERNQQFISAVLSPGRSAAGSNFFLAPLTKGGNVPFRRLCCDFDNDLTTMGEMAFARKLIKGDRVERARLYKAVNERCFGAQIATNNIAEGVAAAQLAQEAGAAWLDLNCGCPIHEATKRGLGAALLRKPTKLAKLVAGITSQVSLPLTVKIRTGETDKKIIAGRLVALLQQAGAAAVIVHGRTMEQRYKKAADWQLLAELARSNSVPVVGNGDILTYYEAADRQQLTGCAALMVGRGALIKPWLFQELKEGRELLLSSEDRIGVYRQLAAHMKQHFGDDSWGRRKAFFFLPWHFSFFCRYRHLPAEVYHEQSKLHPLIATRADLADSRIGENEDTLPLLERLLRCENEAAHGPIADIIWDSSSDGEAVSLLSKVAEAQLPEWEQQLRASSREDTADVDMIAEG